MKADDEFWMELALSIANSASHIDEVPVGAVIVKDNRIIATGLNLRESLNDSTAHAELIAIRKASRILKSWRLVGCTLYVTMEPCVMCSGALIQCRIDRVVYGCSDPKGGGMGSLYNIHDDTRLNHQTNIKGGLMAKASSDLLKHFFKRKREMKKSNKIAKQEHSQ